MVGGRDGAEGLGLCPVVVARRVNVQVQQGSGDAVVPVACAAPAPGAQDIGRWKVYQPLGFEAKARGGKRSAVGEEHPCLVPAINLTGIVVVATVIVAVSWFLDEVYLYYMTHNINSSHAWGAASTSHATSLSGLGQVGGTGNAGLTMTVARAGLMLCALFVITVWGVSAYIQIKYLRN
mmetsp:Transcript_3307/g.5575  ORF Transcript_3307/g.5575 Transcript_3307/m.5575 type:complete len:179 (+) Transcript_3307:446-982(+)|eukprot:CAMPEP_0184512794 /NCGR_PEP_ID=MMETSP0198_2-20121128/3071_1 /TAXON_ID=1112570 /ORGANISM="Thraustochytrium sp., Strain LLF1b" /LENGTH=178 /DNA_ID=CAMNT_0026902843 /DNA_START=446 /DNA_END=982 /DNA_ORIENTATION=+